jgi:hypothetical protein
MRASSGFFSRRAAIASKIFANGYTILTRPQPNSIGTDMDTEVYLSSQTPKDLSEVLLHLHDLVRHVGEHGSSLV